MNNSQFTYVLPERKAVSDVLLKQSEKFEEEGRVILERFNKDEVVEEDSQRYFRLVNDAYALRVAADVMRRMGL